jgi:phosphate transport system substrate-binding protein
MKKTMKLIAASVVLGMAAASAAFALGSKKADDISKKDITVISREEGSGTRGAFIELFGVEQKNAEGKKVDCTIDSADITNSTEVMMTSVAGNKLAIGYISLGSLNKSVKSLRVDGASATAQNIKNGSYKVSRPFTIVTKTSGISDIASDFIRYILSSDGQAIAEKNGYIAAAKNPAYMPTSKKGKITVAGSSSVTPLMEKLAESYQALNPGMSVEVQMSDSTTGVNSAISGVCDIGMASRELKDSETAKGVQGTVIATDGIAVIVNNSNPVSDVTKDSVKGIYTGTITKWGQVK